MITTSPDITRHRDRQALPLRWRMALAFMFVGGGLVVFGSLITLVYLQTTPVTYVTQVHKGAIESVVKTPRAD